MIPLPPIAYAGAALLAVGGSFYAGWTAQGWRCSAFQKAALEAAQKAFDEQLSRQNQAATSHEMERSHAEAQTDALETQIRTIYQERIVEPDCALSSGELLRRSVEAANARANGQSGGPVSGASDAP